MSLTKNLDPEAIRLLGEADWVWSEIDCAFIKARDPMKEDTEQFRYRDANKINYEDLRDHNLVKPTPKRGREAGIKWLRKRIFES